MKLLTEGCCRCQKFTWIDKASWQRLAIPITEHSTVSWLAWKNGRFFAGRVLTDLFCSTGGKLWGKMSVSAGPRVASYSGQQGQHKDVQHQRGITAIQFYQANSSNKFCYEK